MAEAEIFYPYVNVTQLGVDFTAESIDATEIVFADFLIEDNTASAIRAVVGMRSSDNLHFAQFEINGVFLNTAGIVTEKNTSDTVVNRDNDDNYFRFLIVGNHVHLVCSSGLPIQAFWSGIVGFIKV